MSTDFDESPPQILVFGASGYIGTNLVPALLAEGARVRVAARQREVLVARGWPGVQIVEADALAPESLPAALAGIHTAYYLAHRWLRARTSVRWTWPLRATSPTLLHGQGFGASFTWAGWCRRMPNLST